MSSPEHESAFSLVVVGYLFNSGDSIHASKIIKVLFMCEDYLAEQNL